MAGVNVLILGGLTRELTWMVETILGFIETCHSRTTTYHTDVARPFLHYLTDSSLWEGDDKKPDHVKHIRIVDRYLVQPGGSTTTWVDDLIRTLNHSKC